MAEPLHTYIELHITPVKLIKKTKKSLTAGGFLTKKQGHLTLRAGDDVEERGDKVAVTRKWIGITDCPSVYQFYPFQ